jgi:hypothetical protein
MTSKKLGALIRSVPPATATEAPEPPAALSATIAVASAPARIARATPTVEAEVPFQVLIPESIRKQLGHMSAEEGQSLRALALRAFRSLGITVTDAQIKGKRGHKGT